MLKFDTQDTVKNMLDNIKTQEDVDNFFMYISDTFPKPDVTEHNLEIINKFIRGTKYMEISAFDFINTEEITDELWPFVLARNTLRIIEELKLKPQNVASRPGYTKFHNKFSPLLLDVVCSSKEK